MVMELDMDMESYEHDKIAYEVTNSMKSLFFFHT
jgi:hypothetical protein